MPIMQNSYKNTLKKGLCLDFVYEIFPPIPPKNHKVIQCNRFKKLRINTIKCKIRYTLDIIDIEDKNINYAIQEGSYYTTKSLTIGWLSAIRILQN